MPKSFRRSNGLIFKLPRSNQFSTTSNHHLLYPIPHQLRTQIPRCRQLAVDIQIGPQRIASLRCILRQCDFKRVLEAPARAIGQRLRAGFELLAILIEHHQLFTHLHHRRCRAVHQFNGRRDHHRFATLHRAGVQARLVRHHLRLGW